MRYTGLLIIALFVVILPLSAQIAPEKYYIQFTDKDNSPYSLQNPQEYLSQRAIDRRAAFNIPVDMKDIPVNPQYLLGVKNAGATIINPTKWLNGVTIETSSQAVINAIEALPYVAGVTKSPVKEADMQIEKQFFMNESYGIAPATVAQYKQSAFFDYGPSFNQISMLRGDEIHEMGYRGEGVVIGVLDSGFDNADEISVFDTLWDNNKILGTRDFVSGGPVTFDKHYHGTMVLSTMGGNSPGNLIGTAPEASFYLIRTEDAGSEYLIEEYNWVSGAEYADSVGADVLNTSLGYSGFDDPSMDHTYEDMDGNTTPITIGADIAASRGMVVVNSAGNSGSSAWYYITAPADGDSVFAIGAVNAQGIPAGFSGHGPSYDGRVKPNVTAQGEGAYFASTDGSFIYGNGTSFSSPIMAGMMACLLQANPDMNNMELINAVQASSSIYSNPNDDMGYGIPDFMTANNILTVIDGEPEITISSLEVFPNPFSTSFSLRFNAMDNTEAGLSIVDMTGRKVYERAIPIEEGVNILNISEMGNAPAGIYFIQIENGTSLQTTKLIRR